MRDAVLRQILHTKRNGVALLIMVLLIVVFCTIIWLDPMALIKGSDGDMPWNEEYRLVRPGEEIRPPKEEQPEIFDNLLFTAETMQNDEKVGTVRIYVLTDGRIRGGWVGAYRPKPEIMWEVVMADFKGNIDPSKIYSDENGKDKSKLYFIARGNFLILETNSDSGIVRNLKGKIYVTGWLDQEYMASGNVVITSDKKSYESYSWRGMGEKPLFLPDFDAPRIKPLF